MLERGAQKKSNGDFSTLSKKIPNMKKILKSATRCDSFDQCRWATASFLYASWLCSKQASQTGNETEEEKRLADCALPEDINRNDWSQTEWSRPSIDDPRLEQNISLEEQRARIEAELEPETGAGTVSSLRGQIDVLDARKSENELVASKVPNR